MSRVYIGLFIVVSIVDREGSIVDLFMCDNGLPVCFVDVTAFNEGFNIWQ